MSEELRQDDELGAARFVATELRQKGGLGVKFYIRYLRAMPRVAIFGPMLLLCIVVENFFSSGFKWLVAFWVEGCTKNLCVGKTSLEVSLRSFFETASLTQVVVAFSVFVLVSLAIRFLSWTTVTSYLSNGARAMHDAMVRSLSGVRVTFFDENPSGRLVRRFSGDYAQLSTEIPNYINDIFGAIAELTWAVLIVFTQAPFASLASVPCGLMYYRMQREFKSASREVQRLTKVLESPVWALYTETMNGFQTIRAFGRTDEFVQRFRVLNRRYGAGMLLQSRFTRWLNVRLKFVSEFFAFIVTTFVVWSCATDRMGVGTAGFLMSLTIGLDMSMQWLTRSVSMLESAMVSFERVLEYQNLPAEEQAQSKLDAVPSDWPRRGEIEFRKFSMSYRADLPLVLRDFSVTFPAGKQTGIIGRTGAGKSSLFQSLFQMVHAQSGAIFIDGIDIATVPLERARSVFGIIPQEPQLFSGSLRYNLDRTGRFSDAAIWQALETVKMRTMVENLPNKLDYVLFERGANLSVGQRQLLCMARAILCDAKVILMDEATASVDFETENLIHEALVKGFAGRTILIIAHRIETVRGCDEVAVLGSGKLVKFGPTREVLKRLGLDAHESKIDTYLV